MAFDSSTSSPEGVKRLPYVIERHVTALKAQAPEPPHGRSLSVVRLVLDLTGVLGKAQI